jgi:type II secretory pathway component PulF
MLKARSRTPSSRARPSRTRCAKHPKVFDDLFVNLVRAGEIGGILDTILQRLAVYIEKR